MQDMKRLSYILAALLPALAGCHETVFTPRPTIPLVYSIVQDSTGQSALVKSYGTLGEDGSIAIIGPSEETVILAESLLTADLVNNIDGSSRPDSLPDFSGEHFDLLLDPVNAPYEQFIGAGTDKLRENTVRLAVFAMDSLCRLNPYSPENLRKKSRAKILVFSSTAVSGWGQFDVDTLIQLSGGRPLTVSPVQALLAEALVGGDNVNLCVWASPLVAECGVYESAHAWLRGESTLKVFTPRVEGDLRARFRDILLQYRKSGAPLPVHSLLLDDFGASVPDIMAEADSIRAGFSEDDMALAKVLAPDFRIIEATEAISRYCYRLMRQENIFTHNIAYPSASLYRTELDHDGTMVLVELQDRYMPPTLADFLDAFAVKTRSFYVSDND